jgi:hypothetical protein
MRNKYKKDNVSKAIKPILEIGDLVLVKWDIENPFYGFVIEREVDYEFPEYSYLIQPFKRFTKNPDMEVWIFDRHVGTAWEKM